MDIKYGDITWDALCEYWDDCSTNRVWNCFVAIINSGGGEGEEDYIYRWKLKDKDKRKMVTLYMEMFHDHLTSAEKKLLETAGIKKEYVDSQEVKNTINVIMKSKNIITETVDPKTGEPQYSKKQMAEIKTIDLETLLRLLKLK